MDLPFRAFQEINQTYDDSLVIDYFDVAPMCEIDSIVGDSIVFLSGHYYHFIKEYEVLLDFFGMPAFVGSANVDQWYPIDPTDTLTPLKMAFSIYITDDSLNSQYDFPCYEFNDLIDSFANVYEQGKPPTFELFPNPGTNKLSIRLPENSKGNIFVHDVSGRLIHEIRHTQNTLYFVNTENMNRGIYFVT